MRRGILSINQLTLALYRSDSLSIVGADSKVSHVADVRVSQLWSPKRVYWCGFQNDLSGSPECRYTTLKWLNSMSAPTVGDNNASSVGVAFTTKYLFARTHPRQELNPGALHQLAVTDRS